MVSQKKSASQAPKQDPKRSLPLRALLMRLVLVSVSSYAMLDMAAMAFIPLIWAMPADLGGLAHRPVGVQIRMFGQPHPIHTVPARRATGTQARLRYQRP